MAADATTLSTADNTDPFIPKYTDGTPIQWDGNYAHIDGALYERHVRCGGHVALW